jgi:hypothetical protein
VLEMAKNSSPEIHQYLLEKYKVSVFITIIVDLSCYKS